MAPASDQKVLNYCGHIVVLAQLTQEGVEVNVTPFLAPLGGVKLGEDGAS